MWLCHYCESANAEEDKKCAVCGHGRKYVYAETLYCTNCGKKYIADESNVYCIYCGHKLY